MLRRILLLKINEGGEEILRYVEAERNRESLKSDQSGASRSSA
jgi:hypothetical protein